MRHADGHRPPPAAVRFAGVFALVGAILVFVLLFAAVRWLLPGC